MDFKRTLNTTIFHLLIITMLMLLPATGLAAPQQKTDINKPTRERVKSDDKKKTDKKATDKKPAADNKATDNKPVADKKDGKTGGDKKDDKAGAVKKDDKKVNESAPNNAKPADGKPGQDTTGKAAPKPAPKPPKRPINTDTAKFDGIDVSKHQEYINWGELRKNKRIQYVYIRSTVGSDIIDANYRENVHNARKHGFKVGSYHYMTNLSSINGQFENFRRTVDKNSQDLLPMIDVEVRNRWTKQQLRDSLVKFVQLIEDYYGCTPIIYTYETFYRDNLGTAFDNFPLFIAKYSNQRPNIGSRAKWLMWQFSESGYFAAVKGNKGLVDLSRFNDGCSINDILYRPGKTKPKTSVKDAVDHKEKPTTINATEQKPKQEPPKKTSKQKAEEQKKAEKEARAKERSQQKAKEEAAKKAKEKEEADRKAKQRADQKAEQQKREKERQEAAQKAAEEKAKRKAAAKKTRDERAKQEASKKTNKSNKSTSVRGALTQSQRNDSIRAAKQSGCKINKSSADND